MAARILTALVGIPIFLGALYLGGAYWLALLLLLVLLGTWESARLGFGDDPAPLRAFGAAVALTAALVAYIASGDDGMGARFTGGLALVYTGWLAYHAFVPARRGAGDRSFAAALLVSLYPAVYFPHLALLREGGMAWVLFPVLVTWATDTAAFFCGRSFGRRLLAPAISPKKTVEGAVGGLIFGVATAAAFGWAAHGEPLAWGAVGAAASVAAQLGDLFESGMKRKAGVKDSGGLLPGHGGVLDRFDSLMLSSTVVYYLLIAVR